MLEHSNAGEIFLWAPLNICLHMTLSLAGVLVYCMPTVSSLLQAHEAEKELSLCAI